MFKRQISIALFLTVSLIIVSSNSDMWSSSSPILETSLVKEINNISVLKEFLKHTTKCIIEVYSPTCPHCIDFAPKYDILSSIYKDKITFIKIDGSSPENYKGLIKIKNFPSLFIYENANFFQYRGNLENDDLHDFIENVYYFKCKKLETEQGLINFVNDNTRKSYVLGVFDKEEENTINLFNKLNEENKMIIENCYYYINHKLEKNNLPLIFDLHHVNNFIVTYNQNSFNYFTEFSKILNYESMNPDKDLLSLLYEKTSLNYQDFLNKNLFPIYENFENSKLNNILSRQKELLIFSYQNEQEKILMERIIDQYSIVKNDYNSNYTLLMLNLNVEVENKLFLSQYFSFGQQTGIYISDVYFRKIVSIENSTLFDIQNLINFINENNKIKAEILNKTHIDTNSKNKVEYFENKINYVSAKIVKSLDTIKNDDNIEIKKVEKDYQKLIGSSLEDLTLINKTINIENKENHLNHHSEKIKNKNNNLLKKLCAYLLIYSIIFFFAYKKYLSQLTLGEAKKN